MMSIDFLPGFEPPVLIPSNSMELGFAAPAVPFRGEAGGFPVSNRKTPGDRGSGFSSLKRRNPATSGFKPEMVTGNQFRPRFRMDADTPTGGKGVGITDAVISNDAVPGKPVAGVYADSNRPRGLGHHGDSHNGAASSDALLSGKGVGNLDTLGSIEAEPVLVTNDENSTALDQGYRFNRHPLHPAGGSVQSNPSRWSTFRFRVEQFAHSLSRARLAQVARRNRFHSMPWLRLVDERDEDSLP
jgi:hypothetical protein